MRINADVKIGDTETTLNDVETNNNKLSSILKNKGVAGLNLYPGDTYQLDLPKNSIFVEPLVSSHGSETSGGQFITIGTGYSYITNNDNTNNENIHRGMWISCSYEGLVTISAYRHCGSSVTGFRIWYIDI